MTDTLLLDACRVLGLPCRGRINGRVVTWTTDQSTAELALLAGARVVRAHSTFTNDPIGWEVSFSPDKYALTPADHAAG